MPLNPYQKSRIKFSNTEGSGKFSNQVKEKPGIVECFESVMGMDYKLRRSGRAWLALCPFHGERNPSFAMYEDTNSYWCFTCGEKGDSFDLLKKQLNCDFAAAKEYATENGLFKNI